MFIQSDTINPNSIIKSDICIIGGGPAGIAIVSALKKQAINICLLESGDLVKNEKIQQLNKIETTDLPVSELSRARQFGGTTALWVGRWKPHDEIDFKSIVDRLPSKSSI